MAFNCTQMLATLAVNTPTKKSAMEPPPTPDKNNRRPKERLSSELFGSCGSPQPKKIKQQIKNSTALRNPKKSSPTSLVLHKTGRRPKAAKGLARPLLLAFEAHQHDGDAHRDGLDSDGTLLAAAGSAPAVAFTARNGRRQVARANGNPQLTFPIHEFASYHDYGRPRSTEASSQQSSSSAYTDNASLLQSQPSSTGVSSQYFTTFEELEEVGAGSFGRVTKVRHRLDNRVYAVKRSQKLIKGRRDGLLRLREAQALAACCDTGDGVFCANVVRYYGCWVEADQLFLQTEFCGGGSVAALAAGRRQQGQPWQERELVNLIYQLANALDFIHSHGMAHMDVKGENVYISNLTTPPTYKLGDFGLVVFLDEEQQQQHCTTGALRKASEVGSLCSVDSGFSVMEGDARYMPLDMLNEKRCLREADVFSLGITVYELATQKALPSNGEEWLQIRQPWGSASASGDGNAGSVVLSLPQGLYSPELAALLRAMMAEDPAARPTARALRTHPWILRQMASYPGAALLSNPFAGAGLHSHSASGGGSSNGGTYSPFGLSSHARVSTPTSIPTTTATTNVSSPSHVLFASCDYMPELEDNSALAQNSTMEE